MKTISCILFAIIFFAACKKEKEAAPPNYAETLKGTIWGGKYYNITNPSIQISYTITLNASNLFEWKADGNTFPGTWFVSGKQITFRFTIGANNQWSGEVNDNGNELKNITAPVPDGFRFVNCVKNP
jgi:hypothetical protein